MPIRAPFLRSRTILLVMCAGLVLAAGIIGPNKYRVALAKEKNHQWRTGTLVDVSSRDASRLVQGTTYERLFWTYDIEDGIYTWTLQRDTRRRDKPLDVTINASIQFAIEGQDAFVKDDNGQEHKLSVQMKSLKKTTK